MLIWPQSARDLGAELVNIGSVADHTRDELAVLREANRTAPVTRSELAKFNAIKRTFRGTIY